MVVCIWGSTMKEIEINDYYKKIAKHIESNRDKLIDVLESITNLRGVLYEIESALKTLRGGAEEIKREKPPLINSLVIFYPTNVLLYSYILYVVVPSVYCRKITIRPSHRDNQITEKIHDFFAPLLNSECQVEVLRVHQRKFVNLTNKAEVVVHTGQYEKALQLMESYPDSLFLFFGCGTNPFVIGKNSDLKLAVSSVVASRLTNSGQDCMCQDCHFVHQTVLPSFMDALQCEVKRLKFGKPSVMSDYSDIVYDRIFDTVNDFYEQNKRNCIHRGIVSIEDRRIDPMIFYFEQVKDMPYIEEFFAPIFVVTKYTNDQECNEWLMDETQLERSMGVSIFGDFEADCRLKEHYIMAFNQSFMDLEDGNLPFGGYGKKSSVISFKGQIHSYPVLISREVSKFLKDSEHEAVI